MARNRLPFFSYSGDDPEIHLDADHFSALESTYGTSIPEDARARLVVICNQYLFARRTELHSQSWNDVAKAIPLYEQAVEALWALAFPEGRKDDAEIEMETLFDRHLKQAPFVVHPDRGEIGLPGQSDPVAIFPNTSFLTRLSMSMRIALNAAEKEINQQRDATASRPKFTAFQRWIVQLTDLAKAFSLPYSAYVDGVLPDKFARLVASLHQMMPDDLRETGMETAGAAAAKIKRARAAGTKYEREQKQAEIRRLNAPIESK